MTLRPETIALVFGTVLGASLTFVLSQLEKWLDKENRKEKSYNVFKDRIAQS